MLPFKTKSIVSAGEITISADENVVIFSDESFTIANTPITGTIEFSEDGVYELIITQEVIDKINAEAGFLCVGHGYYVDLVTVQ